MARYAWGVRRPARPCKTCGKLCDRPDDRTCIACQKQRYAEHRARRSAHRIPVDLRRKVENKYIACFYCGDPPAPEPFGWRVVPLHVDHIVPLVAGGKTEESNLVMACRSCNLSKGALPLNRFIRNLRAVWARFDRRRP